ncbi:MAG: helix-turn-helix transcriptional regulator [Clostridia bacterium]|nr:helix-turn-helix transcriptional regulator [Clostridia bacterium]
MKLNIAQNLRKYRKERGLTQEELAKRIDISPQSVSKWECGDGYPDIELLPAIANHLKISVDALIGNDDAGKKEDLKYFWEALYDENKLPGEGDIRERRVQFAADYWRKYPEEYRIAANIVHELTFGRDRNPEKFRPLLYETAEKILTECPDPLIRDEVLRNICAVCTEEDLSRWLSRCTFEYRSCRHEVLEKRYWDGEEYDKAHALHLLNNLKLACHVLGREIQREISPEQRAAQMTERRRLIESFAEDGERVPDAWLDFYAGCGIRLASAYFGMGEDEKAYALLDESFADYETWVSFPMDKGLEYGRKELFGGILYFRKAWTFCMPDGSSEGDLFFHGFISHYGGNSVNYFASLTEPNWRSYCGIPREWFAGVLETPRFREYIARAEALLGYTSTLRKK